MNISHLSVSRKKVWETCQQQYRFKYHLKVESQEPEPFYFIYGKIIHKIAEEVVNHKGKIPQKEIVQKILNGEIPVEQDKEGNDIFAPKIPMEYKKRMPGHLSSLLKLNNEIGYEGITEHEFRLDLDPPNEKHVFGFIDRLIIKKDNYFIIDYKTTKKGRWRVNRSTVTKDLQLRTYARVVQREFNANPRNIYAALYYLEGGNLIGSRFSSKTLDQTEELLKKTYYEIENTAETNAWGNLGDHCRRCDYRKLCPSYKLT